MNGSARDGGRRRRAAGDGHALLAALLALPGCDLFHGTDWQTACDERPDAAGCGNSAGAGSGGAGGSGGGSGGDPRDGSSADRAGRSCQQLLQDGHSLGDGSYWIDPDLEGSTESFEVYCDMASGGWTLAGIISSLDEQGWSDPGVWSAATSFGPVTSNDFAADMKSEAWSTLEVTQLRFENADAGLKTSGSVEYASLAALFGEPTRVSLDGVQAGWVDPMSDDKKFFAEVQNPATTAGVNLAQRNRCVLTMGYDEYVSTAQDDQVHGFGCTEGSGGPNGPCFNDSCGDVIRDASLRVWAR